MYSARPSGVVKIGNLFFIVCALILSINVPLENQQQLPDIVRAALTAYVLRSEI